MLKGYFVIIQLYKIKGYYIYNGRL